MQMLFISSEKAATFDLKKAETLLMDHSEAAPAEMEASNSTQMGCSTPIVQLPSTAEVA